MEHEYKRHAKWDSIPLLGKIGIITGGVIVIGALILLGGYAVMLLWNWLMPAIFHLPTIDYAQTWGIIVLSSILFKGGPSAAKMGGDQRRKRKLREKMEEARERNCTEPDTI